MEARDVMDRALIACVAVFAASAAAEEFAERAQWTAMRQCFESMSGATALKDGDLVLVLFVIFYYMQFLINIYPVHHHF